MVHVIGVTQNNPIHYIFKGYLYSKNLRISSNMIGRTNNG